MKRIPRSLETSGQMLNICCILVGLRRISLFVACMQSSHYGSFVCRVVRVSCWLPGGELTQQSASPVQSGSSCKVLIIGIHHMAHMRCRFRCVVNESCKRGVANPGARQNSRRTLSFGHLLSRLFALTSSKQEYAFQKDCQVVTCYSPTRLRFVQ